MNSFILLVIAAIFGRCWCQGPPCDFVATRDCSAYQDKPECGSNGVTYDNECMFLKDQCKDSSIQLISHTPCPTTSRPSAAPNTGPLTTIASNTGPTTTIAHNTGPSTTITPITGPTATIAQKTGHVTTIASNTGPPTTRAPAFPGHNHVIDVFCLELGKEACPSHTEPVCGTDNVTYSNYCEYEKQKCTHRSINVKNFGAC